MFEEYQVVKLKRDIPGENLPRGAAGTILITYPSLPELGREYEVEFLDESGDTIAVLTINERDLELAE